MTEESKPSDQKPKIPAGGRNLVLLGIGAVLITFITTFVSLKLYHDSGDIYLDRSRPGFLPEKEEAESDKDSADFKFSESGEVTKDVIDEYLENLKKETDRLNDFSNSPFDPTPLTDETLGF